MRERGYYSVRTGKHPGGVKIDLGTLKRQFAAVDRQFADREYFQEAFGYTCVDAGPAVPIHDPDNVDGRVKAASLRFRRYKSSLEDRRHAVRELADVLEYLRPKVKKVLGSKDEADLFNLANNFGIRHHNLDQKTDYDEAIWYSWMFYYYLTTIHACLRLLEKQPA